MKYFAKRDSETAGVRSGDWEGLAVWAVLGQLTSDGLEIQFLRVSPKSRGTAEEGV
jgi:hypothetical protein